ncbi:MAG TPA: response regulator [Candidatus Methylomirabilis sp.]|nr:response regulator [Candidatus Methylomirabilis sp.]
MTETILVVDDDPDNRELLGGMLTRAAYRVECADGGAATLTRAAEAPPDLILLDLMMPGMNGLDVCQRLKASAATETIPLIVVAAYGEMARKEAALTNGADDFVTKPVDAEDLCARVGAMLKVRRIRRALDRTLAYLHELEAARHVQRQEALARLLHGVPPAAAPPPAAPPVLLVDDDALTRSFFGDLLAEHGFQVFAAGTGAEALDQVRYQPVEAVILDIVMPGMSGLEVLERLHAEDPDLPVVMLTAETRSRSVLTALKLGAFDFIVKGLEHDLVVLAVHRAVRHRRDSLNKQGEIARLRTRIADLEDNRSAK